MATRHAGDGHTDPIITLAIYAQVMEFGEGENEALRRLVDEACLAVAGSSDEMGGAPGVAELCRGGPEKP